MARRCCRFRNILICVCTQCCCLILFYVYAALAILLHMKSVLSGEMPMVSSNLASRHFVASGTSSNDSSPSVPQTFWEQHTQSDALWNQLQRHVDLHFNPILRPEKSSTFLERSIFDESLLHRSYFEVTGMDKVRDAVEKLPKQIQEFASYMNRRDYPILIHPDGDCGAQSKREEEPPLILFAIKSTVLNFRNRRAIRQTWGRVGWVEGQRTNSSDGEVGGGYIRRVFLLGKETSEDLGVDVSHILRAESERHGDILQWDFQDTFLNLTLKDVLFWSWFSRRCSQPLFVFKGDDDVFVNTPKLVAYLRHQLEKQRSLHTMDEFMVGEVIGSASPNRVKRSKYFIPAGFYRGRYPSYAGGGGVVYSGGLARRLHNISKTIHLFPIDDVYVGMCMMRLNAHPVHHPAFLTFDFRAKEEAQPCSYHTVLLVHKRSPREVVDLWAHIQNTSKQCQGVPLRADRKTRVRTSPPPSA
ncbi:N-acetyllactosaminide beta-1,3-N-acetylglucosaminyltransferase 2 [Fundulus heteroclitus]|uniref:N-acetyllactosaminide beta-1,3-N-acetylglucosaminyltransferase 2 n=1 Tax=Fundulus heteroclitus TaxID=8078 RepID=UPI00165A27BA|nr:N-acetyllactosaminide beta-1,3-N-acetylglucosaminyltransferase 2 [Fundulus heteroclitus]XP_035982893.1 N-acetyllactosaminide beta-1,3-N-acetylglucosaminyltransferase 2 [Fundulus heteroclitus]